MTMQENNAPVRIKILQPDDWHSHLRDESQMVSVVELYGEQYGRVLVMPNLNPPITTTAEAIAYRKRIFDAQKRWHLKFNPLMTLYLTDNTTPEEIRAAKKSGIIYGCKLYPAGATTNSAAGVTDIRKIYPLFDVMEEIDMPLLIHGEATDPSIDIFDREKCFIASTLSSIQMLFANLRIVLEHVTTEEGVNFVNRCGPNVAATITAHHLVINRNNIFAGGLNPHNYCLPIAKRERHRLALIEAAISGNPKFFLGTDSAPHSQGKKESACGCAGCFTIPVAIPLCAEIFERSGYEDWVNRLERFISSNGAAFHNLPFNTKTITLIKKDWVVPYSYPFGTKNLLNIERDKGENMIPEEKIDRTIIPFYAGKLLHWQVES